MLADTVVRRWDDHTPLNRLERIYGRDGLDLARSTICTWHDQIAQLAEPLIAAMYDDALMQPYLCADATGVLVQAKQKCRRGHFWVLVAPAVHVLFRFSARHDGDAVDKLIGSYQGYLVVDAHIVYEHLFKSGKIIEVACWSHARRYFWYSRSSDPERANIALGLISELFRIERSLGDASADERLLVRKQQSQPIVDAFFRWCDVEKDLVLDESPISKAIGYATNQKAALERFLENGSLPLHNNVSELQLRRQAVGRKNWIFVGSEDGAKANTTFVSLLASCRMHQIEPWAYLRDLFCLLPSWPSARVLELAPAYWKQTLEQNDTQRRLAQNVFRPITLPPNLHHDTS
jgi:hypothetical protein